MRTHRWEGGVCVHCGEKNGCPLHVYHLPDEKCECGSGICPSRVAVRGPVTHDIKCWPIYFQELLSGAKTFEYRKDDRGYEVGDQLVIREWDAGAKQYTGRVLKRTVTYIMRTGTFPLADGFAILALGPEYTGVR